MSEIKVNTVSERTAANGVTVDGLNIKDSKLVTADSVVTSNITDEAVTAAKLNSTAVTGQTAETTVADDDTVLIHDTSASALR